MNGYVSVSCRSHCDHCIKRRKRFYLGLCHAEAAVAQSVTMLTLTIGGGADNPDAQVLEYERVKKFWKRLRARGYKFRQFTAGEFGDKHGRAHWHCLVFWFGPEPPELVYDKIEWTWSYVPKGRKKPVKVWDQGFTFVERPRDLGAAGVYVIDYLDKGDTNAQLKSDGLGETFLVQEARRAARGGKPFWGSHEYLASYTVPGSYNKADGTKWEYYIPTDTALYHRVCVAWLEEWIYHRPDERPALNPRIREWLESLEDELFADEPPCAIYRDPHIRKKVLGWLEYEDNVFTMGNVDYLALGEGYDLRIAGEWYQLRLMDERGEIVACEDLDADLGEALVNRTINSAGALQLQLGRQESRLNAAE